MQRALYGRYGDYVDVATFCEREGYDPRAWVTKPHCKGCQLEVIPNNIKVLKGFRDAGKLLTSRLSPDPYFDHRRHEGLDCPYSHRDDDRFNGLRRNDFALEVTQRNLAILRMPDVKRQNEVVLGILMDRLTGTSHISLKDKTRMWENGKLRLCGMIAMGDNPWLLPYGLALLEGRRERRFGEGVLMYRNEGTQEIPYNGVDGSNLFANVPNQISLWWVNNQNGRITYNPFVTKRTAPPTHVAFKLSAETSRILAQPHP